MIKVGIIGYGYWGPNIVRNFSQVPDMEVTGICDIGAHAIKHAQQEYPNAHIVSNFRDITSSSHIDAVAVITPLSTHYELAKETLENGKHLFIEKPVASTSDQIERLIEIAQKNKLIIMVDHTFLFTHAVRKIRDLIDSDVLGDIYYFDSTRANLGPFRHDTNVIWDLASHDLSIMDYVIKEKPVAIAASGRSLFGNGLEDVGYLIVHFSSKLIAHVNVNWFAPMKVRTTLVGAEKKMLVWDDLESDEKIKIYDKGVVVESREGSDNVLVNYRSGDIWLPKIQQSEALRAEAEYFAESILHDTTPLNDGYAGLRIVKMLEAANESLKNDGRPMLI